MDILIVGNGFDLAHGLKTSYKDFLEYCSKKNIKDFTEGEPLYKKCCETNIWMKHFITRQRELANTWIDLENEIYGVIKTLTKRAIIRNNIRQVLYIDKRGNNFNLLKIENFLREPLWNEKLSKIGCEEPYRNYIVNYSIENSTDLVCLLYKHLREFAQNFERYLLEVVLSSINEKGIKYQFSLQAPNKAVHVLSFNYTDTYERLYKLKSTYANPKSYYVYVHGKARNSQNCNLVLGTHSFYNYLPNSLSEEIPVEFNVFKKHNQRHKYGTIEAYQDFLKILTDKRRVIKPVFHVIGHSLDKTDHNILKHVFLANKNAVINIYFHNEEAQERLINNITDIIGEDEVMTKVRLIYQHDKERGILIPKNSQVAQSI